MTRPTRAIRPARDGVRPGRVLRLGGALAVCAGALLAPAASSAFAGPQATPVAAVTSSVAQTANAEQRVDAAPVAFAVPRAAPDGPSGPTNPDDPSITVGLPGEPSRVVQIIVLITVLGVAPSVLLLCTSFTKIVVVLSLTRSALGTMSIPPNQVLVGLALFLSLFVMGPTLDQMQSEGLKPYLDGTKTSTQAYRDGVVPLRTFMLAHTRDEELALMVKAADQPLPKDRTSVDLRTLIPAFVLSELRAAFIIGFVVFLPFLVVDIVVSAVLMSLGMVMLPPSLVSLPFKLLLFVLVDGWSLIVTTLITSYR
ncbi:flagellar type III secretion system pore protein FliP [Kineosporia sp. A_224]|uniref:flagellar type III secretion system pore protein FliP n=1 Tax=Kineosporia sp. A_224 TaxID=1962180 RepID=UPI001E597840|nr:flagellar type III secretion system pore protein FliP [Kineosporia sp. A_224]